MFSDPTGNLPKWLKTGLVVLAGIVAVAAVVALTVLTGGTATAVLVGAGLGALAGGISSATMQYATTGTIDVCQLLIDITVGAVMGSIGGSTLGQVGVMYASAGTGFLSSIAEDWVQGEEIDFNAALKSAAISALFSFNMGAGKQFSTRTTSKAIKGTLKKISQSNGSWTKGLTQIYKNRLATVSVQTITKIKAGFVADIMTGCFQYATAFSI